ncbi:hypothetical protein ACFTQ7_24380 [Lysinibacillus sp. NPDC056959]
MHLYCGQVKQLVGLLENEIIHLLLAGVQMNELAREEFRENEGRAG